jgi:hypothetical protein
MYGRAIAVPDPIRRAERPAIRAQSVLLEILPLSAAASELRGSIGTKVLPQTNIVEISFVGTEPTLVRDVTNSVAREYAAVSSEMQRANAGQRASSSRRRFVINACGSTRPRTRSRTSRSANRSGCERRTVCSGAKHPRMEEAKQSGLVEQQIYYTLVGKLTRPTRLTKSSVVSLARRRSRRTATSRTCTTGGSVS